MVTLSGGRSELAFLTALVSSLARSSSTTTCSRGEKWSTGTPLTAV
jgi:hypothetical protein